MLVAKHMEDVQKRAAELLEYHLKKTAEDKEEENQAMTGEHKD